MKQESKWLFCENELDYKKRELNVEKKKSEQQMKMQVDMCFRYYVLFKTILEDPI